MRSAYQAALSPFGAPLGDLVERDLAAPGAVFQIGLPPFRIDILTRAKGVDSGDAWPGRREARITSSWFP